MDDISLPHDTKVEDILADYFTKKIEGKDTESKGKASDSQHSSKSKKSKKRKHKKKKKHKSRKAHSENEQEEKHSTDDECWVEVTAKGNDSHTKDDDGPHPHEMSEAPDRKQPGVHDAAGQLATETPAGKVAEPPSPSPVKELVASKERSPRLASSPDSEDSPQKNINGELIKESSTETLIAKDSMEDNPKKVDCPKTSDKAGKDGKAPADVDNPSDDEPSPKKEGKKKRRSYRTKRCRSSGSSSDEPEETEEKKEDTRRSPSRRSTQKDDRSRTRHDSRSRRNSRGHGSRERRERSGSRGRIRQQRRSPSAEARDRKRSRASRSQSRRRSRNSRSPSRDRKQPSRRSHTPKQANRRSRSPKQPNQRSRSPKQSRDRPTSRRSSSRHSRSRNLSKRSRSRSRNRSRSAKRSRSSRSRSQRRSRRSRSDSRRRSRRSRSDSRRRARCSSQKQLRSRSQKRSSSGYRSDLKHSRSRSSSKEVSNKSKGKGTERKSTDRRSPSNDQEVAGQDGPNEKTVVVDSSSIDTMKIPESDEQADSKNDDKINSSKNQVVLYGPFEEEEEATSLDEEASPDRALPSGVVKSTAAGEIAVNPVTNDPETVQEGVTLSAVTIRDVPVVALEDIKYPDPETILLPGESPRTEDDMKPTGRILETCETAVEDMDISNSPSSGGALEVEETFSSSYGAIECVYQPPGISRSFYDGRGSMQDAQVATGGFFPELHSGEPPIKPEGLWGFSDSRQQQRVKIDLNKPVGQVKPILREKNIFETPEASKENVLQTRLEDRSTVKVQLHHMALGPVVEQRAPLPSDGSIEAQTVYVSETAMGEAKLSKAPPGLPYHVAGEGTRTSRVSGKGCFSAVPLRYDEPKQKDSENELPPEQAILPPMTVAHPDVQSQIQDCPVEATVGNRSSSGGEQSENFSALSCRPGKPTTGDATTKEALHQGLSIVGSSGDGTDPQDSAAPLSVSSEQTKVSTDHSARSSEAQVLPAISGLSSGDAVLPSTNDLAVNNVSGSSSKTSILSDKHRERSLSKSKNESRSPSRDKSPSKDRQSRSQSKEKSRSLSKDKKSRSRSKDRRSRSKDRKSRSRSRGKKRSRKERSRSKGKQRSKRSRSRQHRSRSRQHSRSQSRDKKRPRRSSSRSRRRSSKHRSESRERQRSPRRRSGSKSPRRSRSKQRQKSRRGPSKGRDKSSKKRSRSKEKKRSRRSRSKERKSSKKGKHSKDKSSKKKSSRCKESSSPDRKDDKKSGVESTPQKIDNPPASAEERLHADDEKAVSVGVISESAQDVEMKSEECTASLEQGVTTGKEGFSFEEGKQSDSADNNVTAEPQPEKSTVDSAELPTERRQKPDPMAQLDNLIEHESRSDLGADSQQTDSTISTDQCLDHPVTINAFVPNVEETSVPKSDSIDTRMEIVDEAQDKTNTPPSESFSDAKQTYDDKSPAAEREESFAQVNVDQEELTSTDVSQVDEAPSSRDLDQDQSRQSDSSPIRPNNEIDTTAKGRSRSSSMSRSPSPDRSKNRTDPHLRNRSPSLEKHKRLKSRSVSPKRRSRSREKKRSRSRGKDRGHSPKKRSRSREKKRSRSREKERSRSREKKRSRSREKKRSRSREKKRSRSREKKRSRSREKKRSRSREKKRSRSRDKRSRSRDKKRSRSRERKRSKSREKKRSRSRDKKRSRSRDRKRSRSRDKRRSRSRDKKRSRSREKPRSRDRRNSRSRSRDKKRSQSREKRRSRSRDRNRNRSRERKRSRSRIRSPLRRKSRSRERLRRRSLSRRRSPIRKKSRSRSRRRSRSRSSERRRLRKSRSREREPSVVKVDKAQLLEAARKNMQAMLQRGVVAKGLPVAAAAAVNATVKVVAAAVAAAAADPKSSLAATLAVSSTPPSTSMAPAAMPVTMAEAAAAAALPAARTSGEEQPKVKKSLAALTDICKAISEEEKREYAGEVEPKTADEVAQEFHETHHHPFKLKDPPPPIRFNIPVSTYYGDENNSIRAITYH